MDQVSYVNELMLDRFQAAKAEINAVLDTFGSTDKDNIKSRIASLDAALSSLSFLLTPGSKPGWIVALETAVEKYLRDPTNANSKEVLKTIAGSLQKMVPITAGDAPTPVSFDQLYANLRNAGQLPQLFDRMISAIEEMIAKNIIDSITVSDALRRLLDTLRANKGGSFLAEQGTIAFATHMTNVLKAYGKAYSPLGPFIDGLEKGAADAQAEQHRIKVEMDLEIIKQLLPHNLEERLKRVESLAPLIVGPVATTTSGAAGYIEGEFTSKEKTAP